MSLDHDDAGAVRRFSEEVDRALAEAAAGFEPWTIRLIAAWVLAGALLTVAVLTDGAVSTILYALGILLVAGWAAGFYRARGDRARWFGS
jgi:hypothetical protein